MGSEKVINKKSKKLYTIAAGIVCGFLNGFFGAGGGTVAVPFLKRIGLPEHEAHATSVAVILPITAVSAIFYIVRGDALISDSLQFVYAGVVGAVVGAMTMRKISGTWLKRIFGALVVFASVRMFFK